MRHDPGTVRSDLQALQPTGNARYKYSSIRGSRKDFGTPYRPIQGTFYGYRTGQHT